MKVVILNVLLILPLLTLVQATSTLATMETNATRPPLVAKLIYHESIESRSYNPNISIENRHDKNWKGFESYLEILRWRIEQLKSFGHVKVEAPITSIDTHIFAVEISVGTPKIGTQGVALDTGSGIFWVHCDPTVSIPELQHIYNLYKPADSKTYRDPKLCNGSSCTYTRGYGSGFSIGRYVMDTIHFWKVEYPSITFGCSEKSSGLPQYSGILGLATGADHSLLRQFNAEKFSYCLGNLTDAFNSNNWLAIGDSPRIIPPKPTTPYYTDGAHYYVNIVDISLDWRSLQVDKEKLRRKDDHTGGAVIDTGAQYSFLEPSALKKLEAGIAEHLDKLFVRVADVRWKLCYRANLHPELHLQGPIIRFHLEGEGKAILEFLTESIFDQIWTNKVCMTIGPSTDLFPFSLIGAHIQQFHHVKVDLKRHTIGFDKEDCKSLMPN